jgi:hypothetical protein
MLFLSIHSIMGSALIILCPFCWSILYSTWCSGRLGCRTCSLTLVVNLTLNIIVDPDSTGRDVTTSIQGDVPWCRLPARQRRLRGHYAMRIANILVVDDFFGISTD